MYIAMAGSTLVASGAADKTVKVTDWKTGEVKNTHTHHNAGVIALDWHPTDPYRIHQPDYMFIGYLLADFFCCPFRHALGQSGSVI